MALRFELSSTDVQTEWGAGEPGPRALRRSAPERGLMPDQKASPYWPLGSSTKVHRVAVKRSWPDSLARRIGTAIGHVVVSWTN